MRQKIPCWRVILLCMWFVCKYVCVCAFTLGKGLRSWATCRSATSGTVSRLGRTRKEAMMSMIIESDITLKVAKDNKHKHTHYLTKTTKWKQRIQKHCITFRSKHEPGRQFASAVVWFTHFSPGMSSRLVIPVQLISSFYRSTRGEEKNFSESWPMRKLIRYGLAKNKY